MQDKHNELSSDELKVISDTEFFRMKREITRKIESALAVLGENIADILKQHGNKIPHEILKIAPKISRGESYRELPWVILDYPRVFSDKDVFAFRSMFWWGNYFSFTIHISGIYIEPIKRKLADNILSLGKNEFYLCISQDQWQHHFENTNYRLIKELSAEEIESILKDSKFIKLGRKLPLSSFSEMINYGEETYKKFVELIW